MSFSAETIAQVNTSIARRARLSNELQGVAERAPAMYQDLALAQALERLFERLVVAEPLQPDATDVPAIQVVDAKIPATADPLLEAA